MVGVLCSNMECMRLLSLNTTKCIDDNGKDNKLHSMLYAFIWLVSGGVGIVITMYVFVLSLSLNICRLRFSKNIFDKIYIKNINIYGS
jgi:hypothetical protein